MIWPAHYEDRLIEWHRLRDRAALADLESALHEINDWWWLAPMVDRTLDWKNFSGWPDPWDLISQSSFCDLARSLGMLYTITMLERTDVIDVSLCQTETDNLVLINQGKYILNWSPRQIVNNLSPELTIKRSINSKALSKFVR